MNIFQINHWRFIDHSTLGLTFDPLQSFAYDDTLCSSVGKELSLPTVRTWVHQQTIVLGIQDSRLPFIKEGIAYLQAKGYKTIVRNSGGLAVVLDDGVLNISLLLKESNKISINGGYEAMFELVKTMFSDLNFMIEAKEIIGSYCPGSYDLSINGKKFAGISQRRVRGGVAVQIYLCINGSGSDRAKLIQDFYNISIKGQKTKNEYPKIMPETMASLEELFQIKLDIPQVMVRLLHALKQDEKTSITQSHLTSEELQIFEHNYNRLLQRNEGFTAH